MRGQIKQFTSSITEYAVRIRRLDTKWRFSAFGHIQITPEGRQVGWVKGKLAKLGRLKVSSVETATDEADLDVLKEPLRITSSQRIQSVYVYGFVVSLFRFRVHCQ
jgi:hypothetical protein